MSFAGACLIFETLYNNDGSVKLRGITSMKVFKQLMMTVIAAVALLSGLSATAQADTHTDFISRLSRPVMQASKKYHLYGSVMMAQAALESDWGTSELAAQANNYFGVRGDYEGQSVTLPTSEEGSNGLMVGTVAQFKAYPTLAASINDYAQVLRDGTTWNPFLYQEAWRENATSYVSATKTLASSYATDSSYSEKLNHIIETYDLQRFDQATTNKDDADHTVKITPGVTYATYKGHATVKNGDVKIYDSVPGPTGHAKVIDSAKLANHNVQIVQRGIIKNTQTIWYQIKIGQTTGWVQLTDLLNLKTR